MISYNEYLKARETVRQYDKEQKQLKKINGHSRCPFCGGTKTKPLTSDNMFKQDCTECNSQGMISNKKLVLMGLIDFIEK